MSPNVRFCVFATLSLLLAASVIQEPESWKSAETVRISGVETILGGASKKFSVARKPGAIYFSTLRGVNGWLGDAGRFELVDASGAFTWLGGANPWVLKLPAMSDPEFPSMVSPVRFSKKDILHSPKLIGDSLGKSVVVKAAETFAGRPAISLVISGRDSSESILLDSETGIALKQDKSDAKRKTYSRQVDGFDLSSPNPSLFSLPADARVLSGVPCPEILRMIDRPGSYSDDNSKAKAKLSLGKSWVKSIVPPAGYEYVSTVTRELGFVDTRSSSASSLANPEIVPGGLPPGWSFTTLVDLQSQAMMFKFQSPEAAPIVLVPISHAETSFSLTVNEEQVSFFVFREPSGAIVISPGQTSREARLHIDEHVLSRASAMAHSDFVDRVSGDVFSLIQLRNISPEIHMRPWKLKEGVETYEFQEPVPLKIAVLRRGEFAYLACSSKIRASALKKVLAGLK